MSALSTLLRCGAPARRRLRGLTQGSIALAAAAALVATPLQAATPTATTSTAATTAATSTGYTQTRYPIVLVHGFLGASMFGPVDYFYGIVDALRQGGAVVYAPSVSAANSSEVRGEQLLRYLQSLQAAYGYTKFNLVGHSQGGTTARYVAAVAPQLVASVTTVGTAHAGTKVADALIATTTSTGTTALVGVLGTAAVSFISALGGNPQLSQDFLAALKANSTAGQVQFNAKYPQGAPTTACGTGPAVVNGIRYDSLGGAAVLTNPLDISDPVLLAGSSFYGTERNDGVVGQCSNHWGTVLRDDYPWNHLDEINQVFGLRSVFSPDPVAVYRAQANRLKSFGL